MIQNIKEMVVVFVFSPDGKEVMLIRKDHPEYLAGTLNGVGGKVEYGELTSQAAYRETKEESGLGIEDLAQYCIYWGMSGENRPYVLHFFKSFQGFEGYESLTSEKLEIWKVSKAMLAPDANNLPWLLPMALDRRVGVASIKEDSSEN